MRASSFEYTAFDLNPKSERPVRVVLMADHSLFRTSLRHLLAVPPSVVKDVYRIDIGRGFSVVGEAGGGEDAVLMVQSRKPDLLLVDLSTPRASGLDALRGLGSNGRGPRAVVLLDATIGSPDLVTAIQLGVDGFVLKASKTERLFEAMIAVMKGKSWVDEALVTDLIGAVRSLTRLPAPLALRLTTRECEVLKLAAAGCPNKEIARKCSVSEETVKHHLTHIFDKVGVSKRTQLVRVASRCGLDSAV